MAMVKEEPAAPSPPPPVPSSSQATPTGDVPPPLPHPTLRFDPSRMIGIIRRKALIKDLAAVYHAECLAYCQDLLELQRKWEEAGRTGCGRKLKLEDVNLVAGLDVTVYALGRRRVLQRRAFPLQKPW
ncbi:hypothetical protein HHK36_001539 [Tetracentron sinense]|uniref:Uncharacterized protein n=1 Tax=Tetracentron sinense TaxID=13715 RepID=A0A835DR87_TETSI|nr:hypothetical protein HHK36_001539 [Tetracentron sinense]